MAQGARQGNSPLDSRPVARARCLALLLALIVPDSQALEQPTRTPSTQNPKAFSFRTARGSHRLACAPTTPEHSVSSTDFVSRAVCAVGVGVFQCRPCGGRSKRVESLVRFLGSAAIRVVSLQHTLLSSVNEHPSRPETPEDTIMSQAEWRAQHGGSTSLPFGRMWARIGVDCSSPDLFKRG